MLCQDYRAGRLLTGQLKARCIKVLQEFVGTFQEVGDGFFYMVHAVLSDEPTFACSVGRRSQMTKSRHLWTRTDK
jgi:tryptophanyl-tRNA synthetase